MAAVTKLNTKVHGHTTPAGNRKFSDNKELCFCFLTTEFTGTYASAGNAIITAIATEIQNSRRDGRTVLMIASGVSFVAPGMIAGVVAGAKTVAISSADITCELTQADGTTEWADGVLGAFDSPITFGITYSLA